MSAPLPPHLDPRGRHHSSEPGRSTARAVARPIGYTLGALLSIALIVLSGYLWYTFREINNHVHRLHVIALNTPPTVGIGGGSGHDIDGQDQNILIVGNDDRSNLTQAEVKQLHVGLSGGSMNTDTMMIVHVPADGSKATLISLPRDSWVSIPGHGFSRLNSAYAYGYLAAPSKASADDKRAAGADLLIQTISNLTGLTINHYVQVSLLGFYDISNAIGGVPVTLCHAVDDTTAANQAAGLGGGSGLKLPKGTSVIKGVQALEFVRQRHFLPRGDLDRVRRQQYFLTAAFRKVASLGILFKLQDLGNALERNVYLDPGLDLIGLAHQLENLTANNISGKTIPTSNAVINGQDVLRVNKHQVQQFIGRAIGTIAPKPHKHKNTSKQPSPIDSKCIN